MKKLWITITAIIAPVVITLYLLSFGNPQWGKWVYMWQAYVYPDYNFRDIETNRFVNLLGYKCGPVPIPAKYTGTWRWWDEEGQIHESYQLVDGVRHGVTVDDFFDTGAIRNAKLFENGILVDEKFYYHAIGKRLSMHRHELKKFDKWISIVYAENGQLMSISFEKDYDMNDDVDVYFRPQNIDHRKKYANLLEDHPELLQASGKKP